MSERLTVSLSQSALKPLHSRPCFSPPDTFIAILILRDLCTRQLVSKNGQNHPDFRCKTCQDGRIGSILRLNQCDFISFFFYHLSRAKVSLNL